MRKTDDKSHVIIRRFVVSFFALCIFGLTFLLWYVHAQQPREQTKEVNEVGELIQELDGEAKLVSVIQQADMLADAASMMAKQSELWAECHTAGNCGTGD